MTAIPVADLVDHMPEAAVVERYAAATPNARGLLVQPAPTETTITVISHQAERREVERAGLDHTRDHRMFYTSFALRTAGSAGKADVIQYGGERWEVLALEDYQTLALLSIATATRIE